MATQTALPSTIDLTAYSDALVVLGTAGILIPIIRRLGLNPLFLGLFAQVDIQAEPNPFSDRAVSFKNRNPACPISAVVYPFLPPTQPVASAANPAASVGALSPRQTMCRSGRSRKTLAP